MIEAYLGKRMGRELSPCCTSREPACSLWGHPRRKASPSTSTKRRSLPDDQRAGKSTTLRTISGLLRLAEGNIRFRSRASPRWRRRISSAGHLSGSGGPPIFAKLTVRENLDGRLYPSRQARAPNRWSECLSASRLKEAQSAWRHAVGWQQQMLAMGRGLMSKPSLLDEPSMGLAPIW